MSIDLGCHSNSREYVYTPNDSVPCPPSGHRFYQCGILSCGMSTEKRNWSWGVDIRYKFAVKMTSHEGVNVWIRSWSFYSAPLMSYN